MNLLRCLSHSIFLLRIIRYSHISSCFGVGDFSLTKMRSVWASSMNCWCVGASTVKMLLPSYFDRLFQGFAFICDEKSDKKWGLHVKIYDARRMVVWVCLFVCEGAFHEILWLKCDTESFMTLHNIFMVQVLESRG